MEFSLNITDAHQIQSYEPGKIVINGETYTENVIVTPQKVITPWDATDYQTLFTLHVDVVLLGCGQQLIFPDPAIQAQFSAAQIGLETMTTDAASRTFNVLAAEGRKVAAAMKII